MAEETDEELEEETEEVSEDVMASRKAIIESVHNELLPVMSDLLEQFKSGAKSGASVNKAICDAIDRQLKELMAALDSILLFTSLDTAVGKNLDNIGDILCLTRAQASFLVGNAIYHDVWSDDELYRKYLKYKDLQNVSQGTYDDVYKALKAVLSDSTQVNYYEDPDYPATIFVTITDTEDNDSDKLYLETIPPIHPAGVEIIFQGEHDVTIEISFERYASKHDVRLCGTILCGVYPEVMYPYESDMEEA